MDSSDLLLLIPNDVLFVVLHEFLIVNYWTWHLANKFN